MSRTEASPRTNSDYFAMSSALGLPARCPLLNHCQRRAHTIALANDWPLEKAEKYASLKKPYVKSVGEPAYRVGGDNNFLIGGQCPEVNLFERSVALIGFSGTPTVRAQYDKYMDPKFEILDTGHYSQCAEYAAATSDGLRQPVQSRSWLKTHYQWLIGTLVAIASAIAAFMAIK